MCIRDRIEERIDIVQTNCEQMSGHVKFVEQTYDVVRCPLNFVKNRIECLMGKKNTKELPYILK